MCVWGITSPSRLTEWVSSLLERKYTLTIGVGVRLIFGVLFIFAAPATRFPIFFQILGYLMIAAAVLIAVIGRERLGRFIAWWMKLPLLIVRLWLCAGLVFGAFILYGIL